MSSSIQIFEDEKLPICGGRGYGLRTVGAGCPSPARGITPSVFIKAGDKILKISDKISHSIDQHNEA